MKPRSRSTTAVSVSPFEELHHDTNRSLACTSYSEKLPVPGGIREPLLSSGSTDATAALLQPRSPPLGPSPPQPPWQPHHAARRPCPAGPRLPASPTRSRLRPRTPPW